MKKMVAMVAFATALMIGASAMAASVDIFVRQTSATTWTVGAQASVPNGQIALSVLGFSSMALSPLSQISTLDSVLVGTEMTDAFYLAGQNLIPIGGPEASCSRR